MTVFKVSQTISQHKLVKYSLTLTREDAISNLRSTGTSYSVPYDQMTDDQIVKALEAAFDHCYIDEFDIDEENVLWDREDAETAIEIEAIKENS